MAKEENVGREYVKKETMMIAGFICLVVGFVGGIAFSAYKAAPTMPLQSLAPRQPVAQPQAQARPKGPTAEQAKRIQDLELRTSLNGDDGTAWTQLGNVYFDTDQFEKSIKAYSKALDLAPDNPDVLTDLGVMYRRNKQPKKALEAFDRAIAANPRHETAWFNKGIVLLHDVNDRDGAIKAWEALIEVNPNALIPGGSQPLKEMIDRLKPSVNP